jgi:hypothetical protein
MKVRGRGYCDDGRGESERVKRRDGFVYGPRAKDEKSQQYGWWYGAIFLPGLHTSLSSPLPSCLASSVRV